MPTFPDVSRTFPGASLERSTLPDNPSRPLKEIWNLETSSKTSFSALLSSTFPDGRPIQARLHGVAVPCLEGIVQRAEIWSRQ